jgi:hypothetical protein
MNFMFEDFSTRENFIDCDDILDGRGRFQVSPMINTMCRMMLPSDLITHDNYNYLISVGVNGAIDNWAKGFGLSGKSIFDYLSENYLAKLRDGTAMFLIDFSLEGYHEEWLFSFFHDECRRLSIPPQAIVYITGNMLVDSQYEEWANNRSVFARIKCLPYALFEEYVNTIRQHSQVSTVDENIEYKTLKKRTGVKNMHQVWTFNCPQKRPRLHREKFFDKMIEADILDKGLCSFPSRDHYILGEKHDKDWQFYMGRIHNDYALKSFVTVVSEPQYYERELSTFTSEKVFKPIACYHPFIVLGGRGELEILKGRGYKTFSDYFDESYDTLDDTERMDAIIETLKYIHSIEDKVSWYESMRPVLEHNFNTLVENSSKPDVAHVELEKYYKEYFGE